MATITGDNNPNILVGDIDANVDDLLFGFGDNDTLDGLTGNDRLDGGTGADIMRGGIGNDTYVVGNSLDQVIELADQGNDTVESSLLAYTLSANVENLVLTANAQSGTGNTLDNVLTGNALNNSLFGDNGNDTLDGGQGSDTLTGGQGDDTYVVDSQFDFISEGGNQGTDTVRASLSYSLNNAFNVENLVLTGTAVSGTGNTLANRLTGNDLANVLNGLGGNDTLDGGIGADTMTGGSGNDTYIVDNVGDVIVEIINDGNDTVQTASTFSLVTRGVNVENLLLTGNANADGFGNGLNNALTGNAATNTLDGGGGDDTLDGGFGIDVLIGGTGNDTFIVDQAGDVVVELAGEGSTDTVRSVVSFNLATQANNVEFLILTGTANINGTGDGLFNNIIGNSGANLLDGGAGADTLQGGQGDDSYVVDDLGDVIVENFGDGHDTVKTALSFDLALRGFNVEDVTLTGNAAVSATGNTLANALTGNDAANTLDGGQGDDVLDGGIGADTMIGGLGNDRFIVDNINDVLQENFDGGVDTVETLLNNFSLATQGANIENLRLLGSAALNATGNELDNQLTGNSAVNILTGNGGNDTLDGGTGIDTMNGGFGNDDYIVDEIAERVIEGVDQGIDSVHAYVSFSLAPNGGNVENLYLLGNALNGTGNGLNNALYGNALGNVLNGGTGADLLVGGQGNDVYVVDNANDLVIENIDEGIDVVQSSVSFNLANQGENVDNLTLTGGNAINGTGNALANTLTGNGAANVLDGGDGNDILTGGAGADTMLGGDGNDTFYVDNSGDVVIEADAQGLDIVRASVSYSIATFGGVENLGLTGSADLNATGNGLANVLSGNTGANTLSGGDGNDTLDGGAGADLMTGGAGDDIFVVDNLGDVVVEEFDQGIDTVKTGLSFNLALAGTNVENLTLTGSLAVNGIGNGLNNVLLGNSAANLLDGGVGNDVLNGGAGADNMTGGAGDDSYVVDNIGDVVTENAIDGTDLISASLSFDLAIKGVNVENLTLIGSAAIDALGNELANVLTGNNAANVLNGNGGDDTLDGRLGADTLIGGGGNDSLVVNDSTDVVLENIDGGIDTVLSTISFNLALKGANVENLTLLGSGNINGTGNAGVNIITGNSGANVLDGGAGGDTLAGGGGNDTYLVDDGSDLLLENPGDGVDTARSTVSFNLASRGLGVDNLTLLGTAAINATGNDLDNILLGNSAINVLDGGIGNDTLDGGSNADIMIGGIGDDTYVVNVAGDVVTENVDQGIDTIRSYVTLNLASYQVNVENLTLLGTLALNATGNGLANGLTGNNAANILDGGSDADTLTGLDGNDTYIVDNSGDLVIETLTGGIDTVKSSVSFDLASRGANVENLTLTGTAAIDGSGDDLDNSLLGNGAANVLSGGGGNDTLNGGTGADRMLGGSGHDIFIIDNAGDVVVELFDQGNDTIRTGFTFSLLTRGVNVENLVLTGSAAAAGTGNELDNHITGNGAANALNGGAGNDVLDGAAGIDSYTGGGGNDTFIVDNSAETVAENINDGDDTVESSVSFNLGTQALNVEVLHLTGSAAIDGTGNALANLIDGNDAANVLTGGDGRDQLFGHNGDDTLRGDAQDLVLDGGAGHDSLEVVGSLQVINYQANGTLIGIERVALGNASNTVVVDAATLFSQAELHTLRIEGGATDHVRAAGQWISEGALGGYMRYTQAGAVLEVALAIDQSRIALPAPEIALTSLDGSNGFRMHALSNFEDMGSAVAGGFDVNGDGFGDFVIGAGLASPDGVTQAGRSFVVFGQASRGGADFDVATLNGANGFRVDGIDAFDRSGMTVSSAGDVNGDGYGDLMIGSYLANGYEGETYLVFGAAAGFAPVLDAANLNGANGVRLHGDPSSFWDWSSSALAGGGDFNGDGYDDLLIGAPNTDQAGLVDAGRAYLVFGHGGGFGSDINLASLNGNDGVRFEGVVAGAFAGTRVAIAGDINGDGFDDVMIGASGYNAATPGHAYVVFGSAAGLAANFDLQSLSGSNGFRIDGLAAADHLGNTIAAAGDINGDGIGDLIVGARGANQNSGDSYVVFGRASGFGATLDLASLDGSNGFRLTGPAPGTIAHAFEVAAAGDVDGDGFDDLLVGYKHAVVDGIGGAGETVVLFGAASGFDATVGIDNQHTLVIVGGSYLEYSGDSVSSAGDIDGDGFDDILVGAPDRGTGAAHVVYGHDFRDIGHILGNADANTIVGGAGDERLLGGQGNDVMSGGAGRDVLIGGAGDDTLFFDGIDLRVDGGGGRDSLRVANDGQNLDLRPVGVAGGHITEIEVIDLTGFNINQLNLDARDVLNLSSTSNVLRVLGDAGDSVTSIGEGWSLAPGAPVTENGVQYAVYQHGGATLMLDLDLSRQIS